MSKAEGRPPERLDAVRKGESVKIDPDSGPGLKAPLVGAIVGSVLLVPLYVLLFVRGRHPERATEWGWCLEAVLSGVGVGILLGSLIGGGIGWVVGAIREVSPFLVGRQQGRHDPSTKPTHGMSDNELDV
jgi:hypothetical protein